MNPAAPARYALFALLCFALFFGCATNTGDAKKDRAGRLTNAALGTIGEMTAQIALTSLTTVAGAEISGGKVDFAHAAAAGLWENAPRILDAAHLQRLVNAYSGNELPLVAASAAAEFRKAAPQDADARAAVVARLARSVSEAAFNATGLP